MLGKDQAKQSFHSVGNLCLAPLPTAPHPEHPITVLCNCKKIRKAFHLCPCPAVILCAVLSFAQAEDTGAFLKLECPRTANKGSIFKLN